MVLRRRGFTLLELLLAIVIIATAIVALQATMAGAIGSAGDAINQRAAREACRTLLEQALASGETSGGGPVPGHEQLTYSIQREERTAGAIESPDEKYDVITVIVTYPSDTPTDSTTQPPGQQAGTGQVKLSTAVDPPDLGNGTTGTPGAPAAPGTKR